MVDHLMTISPPVSDMRQSVTTTPTHGNSTRSVREATRRKRSSRHRLLGYAEGLSTRRLAKERRGTGPRTCSSETSDGISGGRGSQGECPFAGSGQLHPAGKNRAGGDGRGLQGPAPTHGPDRGRQAFVTRVDERRSVNRAFRAGGQSGVQDQSSQHRRRP